MQHNLWNLMQFHIIKANSLGLYSFQTVICRALPGGIVSVMKHLSVSKQGHFSPVEAQSLIGGFFWTSQSQKPKHLSAPHLSLSFQKFVLQMGRT